MKIAQGLLLLVSISKISCTLAMENTAINREKQEEIENHRKQIKTEKGGKLGSTKPYQLSAFFTGKNSIFSALSDNDQDKCIAGIIEQLTVYCTNIVKGREVEFDYAFDVEPLKRVLQEQNAEHMKQIAQLKTQLEEANQAKENLQQLQQEIKSLKTELQSHKEQQVKTQSSLLQNKFLFIGLGALVTGIILKLPAIIRY